MSAPASKEASSPLSPPFTNASDFHPTTGQYRFTPPTPTAIRSPCPIVNSLANHSLIPHTGKGVPAHRLYEAVKSLGISPLLAYMLTYAVYLPDPTITVPPPPSLWSRLNPFSPYFLWNKNPLGEFGMLKPEQLEQLPKLPIMDLDQIGRHGGVEHDVSLSRLDTAQGDNHTRQPNLVSQLLATSKDGLNITLEDWAGLRKLRLQQQTDANKELHFTKRENHSAAAEIAFLLSVFGDGEKVGKERMGAIFGEERLPIMEGWSAGRKGVGVLQVNKLAGEVEKAVGFEGQGMGKGLVQGAIGH
ncbi:uncharacterized protein KY384_006617 [Bacidia gigantensis]|uniref:uncharacterized protein n=1 Tax=Bacidia gigantensis TaxID=2732470 RepID=UPI001D05A535|nr:uncharacterized protein KY384_006617 [Bacidia gigantensis]KAG8528928.1 hypothetical protein KY384_006617 [Bacidia gigantensis]